VTSLSHHLNYNTLLSTNQAIWTKKVIIKKKVTKRVIFFMKWNKRIRDLREDNDMTQDDLASQLGISKRTLLRYESGVSEPTISVLISLSLLFNVSVDYIIGTKDTTEIDEISIKNELDSVIKSLEKIKKEL
jgi:immunity repressor protein